MSFNSSSSSGATPTATATEAPMVGYRFHPTDHELIVLFLGPKILGQVDRDIDDIGDIEVCKFEPWDLPARSRLKSNDRVWYFFCPRQRKFKKSTRTNRTTKEGYWKPDGKVRLIRAKGTKEVIGSKRTLVFHLGRYKKGTRTKWVMHEYEYTPNSGLSNQGDFVLCKLKNKLNEKDTKHNAHHQVTLNPEIESQEHVICEPSHLMRSGSCNKNQDQCIIGFLGESVDANSVESSPRIDSNMGLLPVTNFLQVLSQQSSHTPKSTLQNSITQIYPSSLAGNTSPSHYPNNDVAEVALPQQSSQTLKTILQTSNTQSFDCLASINTSPRHYQNNDITKFTSFDPETQAYAISKTYSKVFPDNCHGDASDGCSFISPSESAILSGIVVDSTHDIDIENQNLYNQDGISSASVEVEWSPSMAASSTVYGTHNQYETYDRLVLDGLLASDLESKLEEPEGNPEFSTESWAFVDSLFEQDLMG